ncbi:hypothetical protein JST56_02000, partial [Candidatus Dependentiae bacterium]|nr:hypothetical protein [Candidatus Dependentiae bacterium]
RVEEVEGVYTITTEQGVIQASGDQLFYEIVSQKFIRAEELKAGDFFLTKNSEALPCISVECKRALTKVYDLTLEEPHLFFSSEAQVLTHNTPILILTIPPLAPVAVVALVFIGAIALDSYVEKFKHSSNRRDRMDVGSQKQNNQHYDIPSGGGQTPDPNDPKKKKDEAQVEEKPISLKPEEEAHIDNFDVHKKKHFIEGSAGSDHKWERLVPDKNWDSIKKIAKDVLKSGEDKPYKNVRYKTKVINGETVEITYNEVNGIKKISNGWVK